MSIVADWLRTLGKIVHKQRRLFSILIIDQIFQITTFSTAIETDSVDQLQNKLKRYTTELEGLRNRGIGKSTSTDVQLKPLFPFF